MLHIESHWIQLELPGRKQLKKALQAEKYSSFLSVPERSEGTEVMKIAIRSDKCFGVAGMHEKCFGVAGVAR